MKLFYEDNAVLVCEKPYGVLSQADAAGGESMVSLLAAQTRGEIYPVHRLDRTTGGLMVFAKTSAAAAALSAQIAAHTFEKEYQALIHGVPLPPEGRLTDLLFYDRRKGKSFVVERQRAGVKEAALSYRVLQSEERDGQTASLLSVKLETGRTHQIRVQFASRGMPLFGDRRYGAKDNDKQIALWSHRIAFRHPVTGAHIDFIAEWQRAAAINAWQRTTAVNAGRCATAVNSGEQVQIP